MSGKRKLTGVAAILFAVMMAVAGCGSSASSAEAPESIQNEEAAVEEINMEEPAETEGLVAETPDQEDTAAEEENPDELDWAADEEENITEEIQVLETEPAEPEELHLNNMPVSWMQRYEDDVVWLYYYVGNSKYADAVAAADKEGKILFTVNDYKGNIDLYNFYKGYAYYRVYEFGTSYEVIVDKEGKEHYRTEPTDSDVTNQEHVIGRTEAGGFLLWVKESGLENESITIRLMTPDGEVKKEYPAEWQGSYGPIKMESPIYGFHYIGEDWYNSDSYAINFKTGKAISADFLEDFHEGAVMIGFTVGMGAGSEISLILKDADMKTIWEDETTYRIPPGESNRFYIRDGIYFTQKVHYEKDGVTREHAYYDRTGNVVLDIEQYPELDMWCSAFYEGYATMELVGKDKQNYFTIINEKGKEQFEPIVYEKIFDYPINGYVIADVGNGGYELFNQKGESVYEIYKDFPEDKELTFYRGNDGFVRCGYSLDGRDYMKVYNVEEAAEKGNDGYEIGPLTGQEEVEEETVQETQEEEKNYDYVTLDRFKIEGKWKSIGDYGFGQAQPGAIVIFDGENCNFFSPNDTYALYKDGNSWRLDVTSLLAETESFTVKMLDEDHIHVIQGSYITDLVRLE